MTRQGGVAAGDARWRGVRRSIYTGEKHSTREKKHSPHSRRDHSPACHPDAPLSILPVPAHTDFDGDELEFATEGGWREGK